MSYDGENLVINAPGALIASAQEDDPSCAHSPDPTSQL